MRELEHEINERRLVEEKFAASEFLLSEAGYVGRVGSWEFDLITNKFPWSKTAYDIYETTDENFMDTDSAISFFVEPHQKIMEQVFKQACKNGVGRDLELQMITAKKNSKWVRYYGRPLFDHDGKLIKLRGILMDI